MRNIKHYNLFSISESLEKNNELSDALSLNLADLSDDFDIKVYNPDELIEYLNSDVGFGGLWGASRGRKSCMIIYRLPRISDNIIYESWSQLYEISNDYKKYIDFLEEINVAIKRTEDEFGPLDTSCITNNGLYFVFFGLNK